jgi:hypothetical protein
MFFRNFRNFHNLLLKPGRAPIRVITPVDVENRLEGAVEPVRTPLVKASSLPSSYLYQAGRRKNKRIDVSKFGLGAMICEDLFDALKKLNQVIIENNGTFYITDLFRTWEKQKKARKDFESGLKKAFVANPGASFHNAGRAVDFDVKHLCFAGVHKKHCLEKFWDLAKPLGFRPIIKIPDIKANEAWHLDYPGKDWSDAYDTLPYSEVAKCAILDVGKWEEGTREQIEKMFIQSQLIRVGIYEIGKVDGVIGPKTKAALTKLGIDPSYTSKAIATLKEM